MDALIAFDPDNHPIIYEYNSRFLDVLSKIAFKNEVFSVETKDECRRILFTNQNEAMNNLLILIFAPYVASLRVLREKCNTSNLLCDTIKSTRIDFKDFLDHIVLHITDNSSKNSTRYATSHMKISTDRCLDYFTEILKFTFGSNLSSCRFDDTQARLALSLYHHWTSSCTTSPAYLLEASDRLFVSASLKSTLTLVLQSVLTQSRDFLKMYGEVPSQSLLYVDGKLASEFATQSSSRMSKKDLMLIQVFVESQFVRNSVKLRKLSNTGSYQAYSESSQVDEDADYFGDTESDYESEPSSSRGRRKSKHHSSLDIFLEAEPSSIPDIQKAGYLLFLEGSKNMTICRTPACIRVIRITESIIILIVSELTSRFLSRSIHSVLTTLTKVLFARQELNGFSELHDFEKGCEQLKKLFERNLSKSSRQTLKRLNELIKCDVRKYCTGFSRIELPTRVDALCSSVCSSLRMLYHESVYMFETNRLKKVQTMDHFKWNVLSIQSFSIRESSVFLEYLEVKSTINMTIDPYVHIIPGLKAFLFVDRKLNILVQASADQRSRQAIPAAVESSLSELVSGNLTSRFSQNDLTVHYFIWFEDTRGNTMKPSTTIFSLQSFPCLFGSDHVSQLLDRCFPCKRRNSICWGREMISCYELLVLTKTSAYSAYTTSLSSPNNSLSMSASYAVNDIEIRCKRLAGKLTEFIVPEHFVQCF